MRLQDFLFPAYPSQKHFLSTQTKLQVTLSPYSDLKRLSSLFTQLCFFKSRFSNEIINETKAAQLLSKLFDEDFKKIKGVLQDFSISKQLLNLRQGKKYAAPGTEDLASNTYDYLINFLSYGYKRQGAPSTAPAGAGYRGTASIETGGDTMYKYREHANMSNGNFASRYVSIKDDINIGANKKSVITMNYSQQRNPISSLKNAGRMDIEKRIHLDNLKKHLSNKFEKEIAFSINSAYPMDNTLSRKQTFSLNSSTKSKNKFNRQFDPGNRRPTGQNKNDKLFRVKNMNYHSAHNQRPKFGSKLASNKSGPLHNRKASRRPKKDKASYQYFLNVASQSLAKHKREIGIPYMSQPESIALDDEQSHHPYEDDTKDEDFQNKLMNYKENIENQNIGSIVNHMENVRSQFVPDDSKRPSSNHKRPQKRQSKLSAMSEDKQYKYTSLRNEKGLSIKQKDSDDDRMSNRSNLHKNRNRFVMNNDMKIKNMYKMVPSKPIMTSVLRRNK
jgi:hypothetical protein